MPSKNSQLHARVVERGPTQNICVPERDPSPLLFWQDQPLELPLPTLPISEGLFSILLCGPCQLLILLVLLWLTDKLTFCNVNTITTPKSELCTLIDHLTINKQSHLNPYPCHLRWVNLLLQGQQPLRLNPVVYAVACWE